MKNQPELKACELLPCPFCPDGGKPIREDGIEMHGISCLQCGANACVSSWQGRIELIIPEDAVQPKSEDELLLIVKKHVKGMANPETVRATIQALKSAGVLFVKED